VETQLSVQVSEEKQKIAFLEQEKRGLEHQLAKARGREASVRHIQRLFLALTGCSVASTALVIIGAAWGEAVDGGEGGIRGGEMGFGVSLILVVILIFAWLAEHWDKDKR
jgi:hypothetical protein